MGKGLTESIRVCYILTMRIKNKPDGQSRPTFTEAARRTQIIECAIETLATLGYAQASLAHIAKRAGISKGVIVYYFSSKEELFEQVIQATADRCATHGHPDVAHLYPDERRVHWNPPPADAGDQGNRPQLSPSRRQVSLRSP